MGHAYSEGTIEMLAARFKVMSEPMRLRLLNELQGGEKTVTELVEVTGAGQANVSKHLGMLYRSHMVGRRKEGLNVYYYITDPVIFEICDLVCKSLEADLTARKRALGVR